MTTSPVQPQFHRHDMVSIFKDWYQQYRKKARSELVCWQPLYESHILAYMSLMIVALKRESVNGPALFCMQVDTYEHNSV